MSFWVYNMGLGVPVSDKKLLSQLKPVPLNALTGAQAIKQPDEKKALQDSAKESISDPQESDPQESSKKQNPEPDKRQINSAELAQAYQDKNDKPVQKRVYKANEIMSSPVRVLASDLNFAEAQQQFRQYGFRHFPVVDKNRKLQGILSERDMLRFAADPGFNPKKITIDLIMTRPLLTVAQQTSIREVCAVMYRRHIGALPVMDDKEQLVGIISRSDILKVLLNQSPIEIWA